ncbi:CAP domain-containing protein [Ruminococcaceae bacterium OttesenSCG-928-L11]|nr:CAP domain-containing protein [Ruminococcaceae bacterium OttesenSCG-928-L11]
MMNNRMKKILACCMALALCIGMTAPVYAAQNPFAYMEAQSRQAVEAAIKAGTVPAGTTIYDCSYGADKNGNTIVVQYRDKNGNWIDVGTQKTATDKPAASSSAPSSSKLTEKQLAEYTQEVFLLVNKEREAAGLEPLERNSILDSAAATRASEVLVVDNAGGKAHTRPDGTSFRTILSETEIDGNQCGENIARSEANPQAVMNAWMQSDGHRKNILYEDYGSIGIGVYQLPSGSLDWVQIFMLK